MTLHFSTKKLLVAVAVLDACAIGGYFFALNSLWAQNGEAQDVSAQVSSYSDTNAKLSSLQFSLKSAEQGMKEVNEYYIPADGAVDFISVIETLAKTRGLTISVDSVDTSDVDAGTKDFQERLVLRLKTEGSWAETEQFLQLIENLPYNVYIEGADLSKIDVSAVGGIAKTGAVHWKGEFQVSALKLK
jgi:Tfp pilus assembly protein PilO